MDYTDTEILLMAQLQRERSEADAVIAQKDREIARLTALARDLSASARQWELRADRYAGLFAEAATAH